MGWVPLRRWAQMLPACIQVCPVELPGRGRRRGEEGISDVAALAEVLVESLPLQVRHTLLLPMPCRFPAAHALPLCCRSCSAASLLGTMPSCNLHSFCRLKFFSCQVENSTHHAFRSACWNDFLHRQPHSPAAWFELEVLR